jgi:ElaB/YqjD/DUF883 family membrane-anchored ribosome-binding protein
MKNGTDAIVKSMDHLKDDIVEGMSHVVDAGRKVVTDKAGDAKDAVISTGNRALDAAAKMIRQRPLLAVGIAFGIGYLAMRLTRR